MLGMVQEQLGGPCGCCRVNRMEKKESQAERGRAGCSEAHRTLEAMESLVLRWETTRGWRQRGLRSPVSSSRPVLSTGSASDRKQAQAWEGGLGLLQRLQNYIRVELERGEGQPVPTLPTPTGFTHRLGMRSEKGRLALPSRRTVCRECNCMCTEMLIKI